MSQRITVLKTAVTQPSGKNYKVAELGYKTEDGKVKSMRTFDYKQKDVFDVMAQAEKGDVLNASFRQNDKGYWEFGSLEVTGEKVSDAEVAQASRSGSVGGRTSSYETTEERARRQVLIVRQSSVSNAIAFVEATKQKAALSDVIKIAKEIEAYVLDKPVVTGEVE